MPFTGNRDFKAHPRLITAAQGACRPTPTAASCSTACPGLWCTGLGHGAPRDRRGHGAPGAKLDYSPAFQFGHPLSFELLPTIVEAHAGRAGHVFFTGSGSGSADTALKIARAPTGAAIGQGSGPA